MCGINGVFNFNKVNIGDENALIGLMNDTIRHRGPDDSGISEVNQRLFFGHRRLSIIDLSKAGHQPMRNEVGYEIVFNGEIYNYAELKKYLPDYKFKSDSDTEVLLGLYEKFGESCLQYLNGMFAFAIWDPRKEQLFLARDRSGKKPLYYSFQNGVFAFSSEVKALLKLPFIKTELDEEAFYHFLTFNVLAPPMTMFRNIKKFHPAHSMTIEKTGHFRYQPYWNIEYSDYSNLTEEELKTQTLERLQKSVQYRMVSNVPVGAFLSGGVDSSALVAMMSKMTNQPVKTYSIGFEGQPDFDELEHARKVSEMFGTQHFEKTVNPDEFKNFLPKIVDIFDEPLADPTCVPIYFISQKARQEGTIVVLTGDGSDEIFAGYRNHLKYIHNYKTFDKFSKLPTSIKKLVSGTFSLINSNSPLSEMLSRAAQNQEFYWSSARSFKESVKSRLLHPDFRNRHQSLNSYSIIKAFKEEYNAIKKPFHDHIDWMCFMGFKLTDPHWYLYRGDKLGMAHSIELRSPFLDYEFVNFALSIPGSMKVKNNEPKYILKKSLEAILPDEVLYRKKMGFCLPLKQWGGEIMIDYVESNYVEFCKNFNLLNQDGIKQILNNVKGGNERSVNDLWTAYFLISWFKRWMHA